MILLFIRCKCEMVGKRNQRLSAGSDDSAATCSSDKKVSD